MPVSVIIGGQYGSEGKGKVSHFFAKEYKASAVIRVGGPNSGHTVINQKGEAIIFKHLPTSSILKGVKSVLTAGSYINLEILEKEISISGIQKSDLLIDPYAVIITLNDIVIENSNGLISKIGSTGCGLGSALVNRVNRNDKTVFAKDIPALNIFLADTNSYLRGILNKDERVIIEGTQGFGLSLLHSNVYPFSTSRDTTASGFLSEAGLSPLDVDDIIMVIRAFPIRVSGNSGPLKNEITWEDISAESGSEVLFNEFTSVSKKLRRVARFDKEIVLRAIKYNRPTKIVLNHLDYIDKNYSNKESIISKRMSDFVFMIEKEIGQKIDFIGLNRNSIYHKKEFDVIDNLIPC